MEKEKLGNQRDTKE